SLRAAAARGGRGAARGGGRGGPYGVRDGRHGRALGGVHSAVLGLVRLRAAVRGGRPPRAVGGAREAASSAPPGGGGRHGPHVGGDGGVPRSPARRLRPAPADRPPAALLLLLPAGRGGPAGTRARRR